MMPTPKQVRYHYARMVKLRWKLQQALTDAHNADVIAYDDSKDSPCEALSECWARIKRTTEKQLAQAMREEIGT